MGCGGGAGPTERTFGNQEVELDHDAAYKTNRRRMVGDLKIHHVCGGNGNGNDNDNDILNEAKQLWPRVTRVRDGVGPNLHKY